MKRITFLFFAVLSVSLLAQQSGPKIDFDDLEYSFGNIKEDKGEVRYRFEFTNSGNAPVVVTNVRSSCGCTTPRWTKEPVLPGTKGYIDVTYNPKNRPGPFNKSITITSNAVNPTVVLHISGNVEKGEQTPEEIYRYAMGDLRLKTNHLAFGNVARGKIVNKSVEVYNNGTEPISIKFEAIPAHIKVTATPTTLEPKGKGIIEVEYNSSMLDQWDFVIHRINILVNGENGSQNRLSISATLIEDFSALSPEQLKNAPKVHFNNKTFEFGTISQEKPVDHTYVLTNEGKSDLIIRKIKASCGCTAVAPDKDIIPAGESAEIKVKFNPKGKSGTQRKSITVITNDPINYKTILWIKGDVQ